MAQMENQPQPTHPETFVWHPTYRGQTKDEIFRSIRDEIQRDQRQYELALDGADQSESSALTSVIELDRRWGQYEMDWANVPAADLAERIVDFEFAREQRQELISYSTWRDEVGAPASVSADSGQSGAGIPSALIVAGAIGLVLLVLLLLTL